MKSNNQRKKYLSYKESLRVLQLFNLEKRRLQRDCIDSSQYFKGAYEKDKYIYVYFVRVCKDRTRGHAFELKGCRFKFDMGKIALRMRVAWQSNRFPREVVDAPSMQGLKAGMEGSFSNLM